MMYYGGLNYKRDLENLPGRIFHKRKFWRYIYTNLNA